MLILHIFWSATFLCESSNYVGPEAAALASPHLWLNFDDPPHVKTVSNIFFREVKNYFDTTIYTCSFPAELSSVYSPDIYV